MTKEDEDAAEKSLDDTKNLLNAAGYNEVIIVACRDIKDEEGRTGTNFSLVVDTCKQTLHESIGMLIEIFESPNFRNESTRTLQ
jgi:hypothetical protein